MIPLGGPYFKPLWREPVEKKAETKDPPLVQVWKDVPHSLGHPLEKKYQDILESVVDQFEGELPDSVSEIEDKSFRGLLIAFLHPHDSLDYHNRRVQGIRLLAHIGVFHSVNDELKGLLKEQILHLEINCAFFQFSFAMVNDAFSFALECGAVTLEDAVEICCHKVQWGGLLLSEQWSQKIAVVHESDPTFDLDLLKPEVRNLDTDLLTKLILEVIFTRPIGGGDSHEICGSLSDELYGKAVKVILQDETLSRETYLRRASIDFYPTNHILEKVFIQEVKRLTGRVVSREDLFYVSSKANRRLLQVVFQLKPEEVSCFEVLFPERPDFVVWFAAISHDRGKTLPSLLPCYQWEVPFELGLHPLMIDVRGYLPFGGYTEKLRRHIVEWERAYGEGLPNLDELWERCFSDIDPAPKPNWMMAMRLVHMEVDKRRDLLSYLCRHIPDYRGHTLFCKHREYLIEELVQEITRLYPNFTKESYSLSINDFHACFGIIPYLRKLDPAHVLPCLDENGDDWDIALIHTLYALRSTVPEAERWVFVQNLHRFTSHNEKRHQLMDRWTKDWLAGKIETVICPELCERYQPCTAVRIDSILFNETFIERLRDSFPSTFQKIDELWEKYYEGEPTKGWVWQIFKNTMPLEKVIAFLTSILPEKGWDHFLTYFVASLNRFKVAKIDAREECSQWLMLLWPEIDFGKLAQIREHPDEQIRKSLGMWWSYTLTLCCLKRFSKGQMEIVKEYALRILKYRVPTFRYDLSRLLVELVNKNALSVVEPVHTLLPNLFLTRLTLEGVPTFQYVTFIRNRIFRDPKYMRPLIQFLNHLLTINLSNEDKSHLLAQVFQGNIQEVVKRIEWVNGIIELEGVESLTKKAMEEMMNDLSTLLFEQFSEKVPLAHVEDFGEKYSNTFGKFRQPDALIRYAASLNRAQSGEKPMQELGRFVTSVLEGTFHQRRYHLEGQLHMEIVFSGREALLEQWKRGITLPVDVSSQKGENVIDFLDILKQKVIRDGHLSPQEYPWLAGFLQHPQMDLTPFYAALKDSNSPSLRLQKQCIHLCNPKLTIKEQLRILENISLGLEEEEFLNDVKGMIQNLRQLRQTKKKPFQGYTAVVSDDPCDLLLCGTEVEGSCQRIDGSGSNNKCLLGYILDGKNKLVAIKNKSGKIVARRILRMLWDEENKTPVLFLERIYPSVCDERLKQALISTAKKQADILQLPLLSESMEVGSDYKGTVESLSCPAPYEYVDSGSGTTDGVYTITCAIKIHSHAQ